MSAVGVIVSADTKALQTSAQSKMIQNGRQLKWLTEAIAHKLVKAVEGPYPKALIADQVCIL